MKPYGWVALGVLIVVALDGFWLPLFTGQPFEGGIVAPVIILNFIIGLFIGNVIAHAYDDKQSEKIAESYKANLYK